jgi:hypothetical protein
VTDEKVLAEEREKVQQEYENEMKKCKSYNGLNKTTRQSFS